MAKRRSNHEGSIWQRQDGRWTGAALVLTTAGTFKRAYAYGRSREEAHTRLVKLQDSSARGIPQPVKAWKVGEYLDSRSWAPSWAAVARCAVVLLSLLLSETIYSVGLGKSSRTVHCGPCAGPTFHSRPLGTGVVQRLGSSRSSRCKRSGQVWSWSLVPGLR